MDSPPRSKKNSESDPPPGAERFWGQFSQASARSNTDQETDPASDPGGSGEAEGAGNDQGHECLEWCPICRSAELLRQAATPELAQQVTALQRETAGVLKAFIQAYGEKAGEDPFAAGDPGQSDPDAQPDDAPPRVTEIKID